MPKKSFEVKVEPEVLKWARETAGYTKEQAATKIKVSPDLLNDWEMGKKKPTILQIKKLSKLYKRPLAVFFLSKPPDEPPLPEDYRSLPENRGRPLSLKTRMAIRRARRLQRIASELSELINREISFDLKKIKITLTDDPEKTGSSVREVLGITIEDQISWKNEKIAFSEWKKSIENKGILVFQMPMPLEEARGFSLIDDKIPVIVLNETDAINAKIFSLFHELAHLLLERAGLCDMEQDLSSSSEEERIEQFCNHFAGSLLVPQDAILQHPIVNMHGKFDYWSDDELNKLAKEFKVSKEVILRRLVILNQAKVEFYREKKEEWKKQSESISELKKKWVRTNPPKKCLIEVGFPVISLVLESYKKEKITYSDVSDYLSLRIKHIPKLEQLIEGYL